MYLPDFAWGKIKINLKKIAPEDKVPLFFEFPKHKDRAVFKF